MLLQLLRHHGEAGLARGGWRGTRNKGRLGRGAREPGGRGHGTLLLLLDPVILDQLRMLLLLLPNLQDKESTSLTRPAGRRQRLPSRSGEGSHPEGQRGLLGAEVFCLGNGKNHRSLD